MATKFPTAEELCDEFCRILNEWLDPSEIREVNRRNALPEYTGCCASHDFCDPNQAMADALEVFGIEFHPELCDFINSAWDLARERQFAAPESGEENRTMIRKGDIIRFKPEWMDTGDETKTFIAAEDECDGRFDVIDADALDWPIPPRQRVDVSMIAEHIKPEEA